MAVPRASRSSLRSLTGALRSMQVGPLVARRSLSTSSPCMSSKSPSGNDATPARSHRSNSPATAGGPDVDAMTGEPRNSSTQSKQQEARTGAEALADLAQGIGQARPEGLSSLSSSFAMQPSSMSTASPAAHMASQMPALAPSGYSMTSVPLKADPVLKALINNLMRDGKKATATHHVLLMLQYLAKALHADPLPAVKEAIRSASPLVRMQTRKQGGKNTQVPLALHSSQSRRRGIVSIIEASRKRNDNKLSIRLAKEVIAVLEGSSAALNRKLEIHKLATANRSNTGVRV